MLVTHIFNRFPGHVNLGNAGFSELEQTVSFHNMEKNCWPWTLILVGAAVPGFLSQLELLSLGSIRQDLLSCEVRGGVLGASYFKLFIVSLYTYDSSHHTYTPNV